MSGIPSTLIDKNKCVKRNRIAAHTEGLNAVPIRFLQQRPVSQKENTRLVETFGKLEASDEEAVDRINKRLAKSTGKQVTIEDIHVHHAEAANNNFIHKYYLFLGDSTLKNFVSDAENGVAFMNSHRTGGFSTESELPFGITHSGEFQKFESDQSIQTLSMLGFYMLSNCLPNGANGPNTDDLSRMIHFGVLQDCSVGFYPGDLICNVCGNDSLAKNEDGEYLCRHIPGTYHRMNDDEKAASRARGVPDGKASTTSENGGLGELSGVYDGAVPGAGFRKGIAMARTGQIDKSSLSEFKALYGAFLGRRDLPMDVGEIADAVFNRMKSLVVPGFGQKAEELEVEESDKGTAKEKPEPAEDNKEMAENNDRLVALEQQLKELSDKYAVVESENKALKEGFSSYIEQRNETEATRKDREARELVTGFIGYKINPSVLQVQENGDPSLAYQHLLKQAKEDPEGFKAYMNSQAPIKGLQMHGRPHREMPVNADLTKSVLTDADRTLINEQALRENRTVADVEKEWVQAKLGRQQRDTINVSGLEIRHL